MIGLETAMRNITYDYKSGMNPVCTRYQIGFNSDKICSHQGTFCRDAFANKLVRENCLCTDKFNGIRCEKMSQFQRSLWPDYDGSSYYD